MKPYTKFLRSLVFPLGSRFVGYGDVMPYLHSLEESQWWTHDPLCELQNRKLQRLIAHVYQYVPFYRRVMKAQGLTPADFQTTDDLVKLPITDKYVLTNNLNMLRDHSIPKNELVAVSSSGSTGERLHYWTTRKQKAKKWAGLFRYWEMAGYDFGERYATFTVSSNRGFINHPKVSKLEWGMMRHLWLPMIEITDEKLDDYAQQIAEFQPVMLRSYASTAYFLARYMNRKGLNIDVPAIVTTGETLSPHMRETIERAFAPGRVFNEYGGDGMQIAGECDHHTGLHLNSETIFTEVIRNGKRVPDGEMGELVFTNLEATATPFIRYNIQDVGAITHEPCSCGRGLPRITNLEGRLTDLFATHDGRWLSVHHFTGFFGHTPEVDAFQVIQHSVDEVEILLVVNESFTESHHQAVINTFSDYFGDDINLTLTFVDNIPTTPAGKRRFFISEVLQGPGNTMGVEGMAQSS